MRYLTLQEIRYLGSTSCGPRLAPLMSALLDLEAADPSVVDPDLSADIVSGHVEVQMVIEAGDPAEAMVRALATLRSAIHAIGDATPGWETEAAIMHVAPEDAAESLLAHA